MEEETLSGDLDALIAQCPECQTGVMHLQRITYFTWLNDELVTVPNFPAWICDMCGRREYDPRTIKWLNTLLHPEAGRRYPPQRRPSTNNPPLDGQSPENQPPDGPSPAGP